MMGTINLGKTFKTLIIVFIFLFITSFSFSCKKENEEDDTTFQDEIDNVIGLINDLGSVTLNDKDDVEYAKIMYDELSSAQKELVTNYEKLEDAINLIAYLENEDSYVVKGYKECSEYLNTIIPSTLEETDVEIELPYVYNYQTSYKKYNFILTWSCDNTTAITNDGTVYHTKNDVNVTLTCKITCSRFSIFTTFNKEILVKKSSVVDTDKPLVIGYYYGAYSGITPTDAKTLDVVNYSFAQIAKKTETTGDVFYIDVSGVPSIAKVKELHNYGIKVCLSLGGWHDDSSFWDTYAEAASTDKNRKMVASAILETMEKYSLDGIDMDWEYPTKKDRSNFTLLMKEIYTTLKAKSSEYIISGAFPYGTGINSRCDMAALNNYLDYFNFMTYDMDFDGSTVAKHMCAYSTTKSAITSALSLGISREKIVIGMAFYCRAFYGVGSTNNGFKQTCTGREALNYKTVKNTYLSRLGNGVTEYYDSSAQSYYLYDSENQVFISYESCQGIKNKYNLAYTEKIAGVMYWSYNDDSSGDYMNAIYEAKLALDSK